MSVKRSSFRAIAVALAAVAVAGTAPAKPAKKKDAGPEKSGGMMEEGKKDPAETETMEEDGAFVPGKNKKKQSASDEIGASTEGEAGAEAAPEKPKEKAPPVARKTVGVFVEGLLGVGSAPLPGPPNPDTNDLTTGKATAFAIQVGGHYDLTPAFRLMVRVPWSIGTVRSGGRDASTNALGDPEVAARYRLTQPGDVEWAVRLGVGIPIAQGNTDYILSQDATGRAQNLLLRVSDAASGWHDQELYVLKRIPITPALLFTWRADKLRVNGEFKVSVMPKIGGTITSTPGVGGGTLSLPGLATYELLGGSASYEVLTHGFVALAAWARFGVPEQVKYDSSAVNPSPFQLVVEPKILAQFGHVVPALGFVLPIGGQLGGNVWGLRLHIDAIF